MVQKYKEEVFFYTLSQIIKYNIIKNAKREKQGLQQGPHNHRAHHPIIPLSCHLHNHVPSSP